MTSSPPGLYCGNDCSDNYLPGAVVTLTPTAAAGSVFCGMERRVQRHGACIVTMDAAKSATATFNVAPITLTIVKNGSGTGTVTSNPTGINCGSACVQAFTSGTVVNLYVDPRVRPGR